jgi:hypothetical protein
VLFSPKYKDGEWKSRTNRELEELNKEENTVKLIKRQRIIWLGHLERIAKNRMAKKIFSQELEGTKRNTQERMERRNRKRSSSAESEKMERVIDREKWRGIVRQAKAHSGL